METNLIDSINIMPNWKCIRWMFVADSMNKRHQVGITKKSDTFINNQCNQRVDTQASFFCHHSFWHKSSILYKCIVWKKTARSHSCTCLLFRCLSRRSFFLHLVHSNLFGLYKFHARVYFRICWLLCKPLFSISLFRWIHQLCIVFVLGCACVLWDLFVCVRASERVCVYFVIHLSAGSSVERVCVRF